MDQQEKPQAPTPSEPENALVPLPQSTPEPSNRWDRFIAQFPSSALNMVAFDVELWFGPAQNSKRERLKHLLLSGRFIVLLLVVGSILQAALGAFSAAALNLGIILVTIAMCSLSFSPNPPMGQRRGGQTGDER